MGKRVKVEFYYEGCVDENEIEQGVLLGDMVLVVGKEGGAALYKAYPGQLGHADAVLVNLDEDSEDYLSTDPELLIDLLVE